MGFLPVQASFSTLLSIVDTPGQSRMSYFLGSNSAMVISLVAIAVLYGSRNVTASATAHIGVKQGPDLVKSRMM